MGDQVVQGLGGRVRGVADGGDDGVVWAGEVGGDEATADACVVFSGELGEICGLVGRFGEKVSYRGWRR